MSQLDSAILNAFYLSEIVVNEAENLSAIVIRPGINANGFCYSDENMKTFAVQLPNVPLVKDHSMKVEDNIGKWKKAERLMDGSVKGSFQISAAEPTILTKIKDGTIRYMSTAHTIGNKQFCTVCNQTIPPMQLCKSHKLGQIYDNKIAAIGFEDPKLLHVSLVQNPADLGCAVVNSFLAEKVENLSANLVDAQSQYAIVVAELKGVREELDRLKRLKVPEPPGRISITPPPEPPRARKRVGWLGEEEP